MFMGHLLTDCDYSQLAAARDEIKAGYTWMFELAKLSVPDEVAEDTADREVIIRYTPLGSGPLH